MDKTQRKRKIARASRVKRVRKELHGSAERPRFSVSKTNCHIYAQLIDDDKAVTLIGLGTQSKSMAGAGLKRKSKESAREIGKQIAELAKRKNILSVIFDRGRYKFHGIIAELANAAREAGLQF